MDTATIASLATAAGTLVLAVATFSSTRSANRAARVSEQALNIGLRPLLFNARPQDPPQKVGFADERWLVLHDGLAAFQLLDGNVYMGAPLRNVAAGIAVVHGWRLWPQRAGLDSPPVAPEQFRVNARDLYVPAGDVGFWQAALRDPSDELYEPACNAIAEHALMTLDLLYGDHEGGQRTITRFFIVARSDEQDDDEPWLRTCSTSRHWNLDRADPC